MYTRSNNITTEDESSSRPAIKGAGTTGFFHKLRCWYIFPIHPVLTAILATGILRAVNNKVFAPSTDEILIVGGLRQSDITNLVSAGLVLVRFALSASTGLAIQRCLFILLEKHGLTLSEIGRLFTFNLGPWGTNSYRIGCTFALLLFIPAQISAPLLSGAISWLPGTDFSPSNFTVPLSAPGYSNESPWWGWFGQYAAEHRPIAKELAAGMYTQHSFPASFFRYNGAKNGMMSRRHVNSLKYPGQSTELSTNTTVNTITMPYFQITNLEWIDSDIAEFTYYLSDNGLFNFTSTNPLWNSVPGLLAIVRDKPFKWTKQFPTGEILNETLTIITYAGRTDGEACSSTSQIFGSLPPFRLGPLFYQDLNMTQCYILANATITAGLLDYADVPIISRNLLSSSPADNTQPALQPNPFNELIMQMIPEVTYTMAVLSISQAPIWGEENLKGYIAGSLSAAYQASWNALADRFNATAASSVVQLPSPVLRAEVDIIRVYIWIGLNLLTLVAAALLVVMQQRCTHEAVVDLVATCLLVDPADVVKIPEAARVCDFGDISGDCSERVGKIMVREKDWGGHYVNRRVLWRKESKVEERVRML